jgi:hypothetical protein
VVVGNSNASKPSRRHAAAQPGIGGKTHGLLERVAVAGTECREVRGRRNCQPGSAGRREPNVGRPGAAAGVARIGAGHHGDGGDAQRDGDRGTGTGPTRDQAWMLRIAHGAIGTAGADQTATELVEVRLAEDDGPCIAESFDGDRSGWRLVGELSARRGGRQTHDVDVVLDGDQQSRQGQALSRADPLFDGRGVTEHIVAIAQRDPDLGPVGLGDPPVRGGHPPGGREMRCGRRLHSTWGAMRTAAPDTAKPIRNAITVKPIT